MNNITKTRYAIFQILLEVFKKNKNFDTALNKVIFKYNFNQKDISFINNVCLNTMRRSIHIKIILKKYVKSKLKINEFTLLSSALSQILYLNIKHYAVVNETVNVAKKINVFTGFINATLKNIIKNADDLRKLKIGLGDFPKWFVDEVNKSKNFNLNSFMTTFYEHPSLHLVFKSEKHLDYFKEPHSKSSKKSAFVDTNKKVKDINNYKKGEWWVQDFSSMLPLAICNNIKNLNILDLCAAPGGKSFQILQKNKVVLNDINRKRIQRLKENLSRLGFNPEVTNLNALDLNENKQFDMIIIDAPCSSVGTIRKNPEILFRSKEPNLKLLNNIQHSLLKKSSKLLKKKGKIIYMVCSFLNSETVELVRKFLDENKNFKIEKYTPNEEFFEINNFITREGYFLTTPTKYKEHYIDGFFSVQLIKND